MAQSRQTVDSDTPSFKLPVAINVVALPLILISQQYFLYTFEARQIDLPFQTEIAIGIIPLVFLLTVLVSTILVKQFAPIRFQCIWELVSVVACGLIIGHHVITMWLAFSTGPVDLAARSTSMLTNGK